MSVATDASTDDVALGGDTTPDGTESITSAENSREAPCRVAARCLVRCPHCGRRVQIKTLRYTHVCSRSFKPLERALEQKKAAEAAIHARVAQKKHTQERAPGQNGVVTHPIMQTQERHMGQADRKKKCDFAIC